jgi:hypothetical protein
MYGIGVESKTSTPVPVWVRFKERPCIALRHHGWMLNSHWFGVHALV